MAKGDVFGFEAAAQSEAEGLDLSRFAPRARPTDRSAAAATREVARDAGFTRRSAERPEPTAPLEGEPALAARKSRRRRVRLGEVLGVEDRYPDVDRAQLNMLAPVPVVLQWRKLVQEAGLPAWEVLERAMQAYEAASKDAGRTTER